MSEWRMANIVNQCKGFSEVSVQPKRACNCTCDLRDFDRMGEPIAEVIGKPGAEDLRFGLQSAERPRMDNPVAVAGVLVAIRMGSFRKPPATGRGGMHAPRSNCSMVIGMRNFDGGNLPLKIWANVRTSARSPAGRVPLLPRRPYSDSPFSTVRKRWLPAWGQTAEGAPPIREAPAAWAPARSQLSTKPATFWPPRLSFRSVPRSA